MIRFVTGLPGSGKSHTIRTLLTDALSRGMDCVLLVPEQQAVLWERELAAHLPPSAWLKLELTNFTRLANTVFRLYGGLAQPKIDDGGQTLVLWRALLSVYDSLTAYGNVTGGREDKNLSVLGAAIAELKQNGVSPSTAGRAAEILSADPECAQFAARFSDISLVYAAYEEILHTEYSDREDVMEALCRTIAEKPYFAGKAVFVDSFYSVTVPEKRILRTVFSTAAEVTLTFACPRADTGEVPFVHIRKYLSQMERLAAESGQTVTWLPCETDHRHHTPGLSAIVQGLYAHKPLSGTAENGEVTVTWCADRYEEAEAVAAVVEELAADGARYRDIAVAARDVTLWHGILDETLRRHGIPVFVADTDTLSKSAPVRLILSLCAVENGGYNRRDLCRMIDTGLTPLTDREADCFAAYTKTWNLHGRRAYLGDGGGETDFVWNFNPDGYRIAFSDWGRELLAHANAAREKLLPAIGRFSDIFLDREAAVEVICRAVVTFCLEMDVPARLDALAAEAKREGRAEEGVKTAALWSHICDALDKMVSSLGGTMLDCGRFAGLFARVIGTMEIGAIPTGQDVLSLGSADGVRFGAVRHMLLVDCVEGIFPGSAEDNGFFREIDRILLEGAGVSMPGKTGADFASEEAFMFYRLACAPSDSLHLFLPRKTDGEARVMADTVKRIADGLGVPQTVFSDWPLSRRMRHPASRLSFANADERQAASLYREKYRAPYHTDEAAHYDYPLSANDDHGTSPDTALFGRTFTLSQSKLDRYASCPFSFFCHYGMVLQEERVAEISAPDIGTFVHAILEQFFRECAGRTYPIPEAETEEMADRLIAEYLRALGIDPANGRLAYLFTRLRRHVLVFLEAVMREFAQSRFVPAAFEIPMGASEGRGGIASLSLPLDNGMTVSLTGTIDRIDTYTAADGKKYVRVVDYKTGGATFSLADIREGLHVQLLLYLFTLWKGKTPFQTGEDGDTLQPAGAVYLTVRPQEKAADDMMEPSDARELALSGLTRSGIYLDDREILDAMDCGLSGKYVQIKEKKDGTLSGSAVLASMAQFGQLYTELTDTIRTIAAAIANGTSPARPRGKKGSTPCDYCVMRPVCRYRKKNG